MKPTIYASRAALEELMREGATRRDRLHDCRRVQQGEEGLRLEVGPDGRLEATRGDTTAPVSVRRCFPWSLPTRHLSLRDDDENEFALVRDIDELEQGSRAVLEHALVQAGFVFDVLRVLEIDEEIEIRHWKVETDQGSRCFQTKLDDWPREVPGGGILIRDVAGDLYHVRAPASLDCTSRELLWAFVG